MGSTRTSTLWVNDTPDQRIGDHGHRYVGRRPCVQVSFEAENGTATRVSFDPETGEASVYDISESQR